MKLRAVLISAVVACAAGAQTAPTKIAIIEFQKAVLTTAEGAQAAAAMRSKYDPKKAELTRRQAELTAVQEKLQKGGATLPAAERTRMQTQLTTGGRKLNQDIDDLNQQVQEDQGKTMQGLAARIGEIIKTYAAKNGFAVVLDVSGQQTPVLWAAPSVNITAEIVKLYDQAHPVMAGAPAKK